MQRQQVARPPVPEAEHHEEEQTMDEPQMAKCFVSEEQQKTMRERAAAMRSTACPWCSASLEWYHKRGTNARDYYRCNNESCGYEECIVHPQAIMRQDRAHCKSGAPAHHLRAERVDGGGVKMRCSGCGRDF